MIRKFALIPLLLLIINNFTVFSQYNISGIVTDSTTGQPVKNARAEIFGMNIFTFSDSYGKFNISLQDSGLYTVTISAENYNSSFRTLFLTQYTLTYQLNISLGSLLPHTDTIDVNAEYYKKAADISTSYINTQYEEIRKNPGSFEDVVKYYTTVPGVTTANDNYNQILVRGGAPTENLILIDGFEIPNLNHYGPPGTSNGALSFISSKLIGEVDFFTGGFPARYGDKISSVMDIKYKKGNTKKHIKDINISATGFGGFFEGPLGRKISYMFSVRKSYLALLKDQIATDLLPEFWDLNMKLNYRLSRTEELSFFSLFVMDHAESYKELTSYPYDTVNMNILNTAIRYRKTLPGIEYSSVTGYSNTDYDVKYILYDLDVTERYISNLQNLSYKIDKIFKIDLCAGLKYYFSDYRVYHSDSFNESGYYVPKIRVDTELKTFKANTGINITAALFSGRLIINAGLRYDYFQYMNHKASLSPRFGAVYKLTANTNLVANAGIYYQAPELNCMVTYPENRELNYIRADEIVLGAEHFIGNNIKIKAEGYLKQYYDYPVSIYNPFYLFLNNGVALYPNFLDKALSAGRGYFTGIDIEVQKKNNGYGMYWSAAYSFSHSKFLALAGDYQPAEFDVSNQLNVTAGFKFSIGLSLSTHLKYAGGRPYTPYDITLSHYYNKGVFQMDQYNKGRLPEYIRWDLRVEQQFQPFNTELTVYVEVLNILNRENLDGYGWDYLHNRQDSFFHFRRLPVLGISWKF